MANGSSAELICVHQWIVAFVAGALDRRDVARKLKPNLAKLDRGNN